MIRNFISSLPEILGSAWIPDISLLGLSAYFRVLSGSWLAPSSFLGLYWVCVLTASLLAMDHRIPGLGIWVLVSLIATVQLGSFLAEGNLRLGKPASEHGLVETTRGRLRRGSILLILTAIAGCSYFVWSSLDLFGQEFGVVSLIQMAGKWTVLRYAEYTDPWPLRVAAVWVYPVALVGGMFFSLSSNRRDKFIGIASLAPSLLLTFLSGGRTAFVLALASWLGGSWAARVACAKGHPELFGTKTVLSFAALAAGLLLIFVAVNTSRGARFTSDPADLFLEFNSGQVRNYMFGTPAAFADWIGRDDQEPLAWGGLTFQGLYDVLHIRKKTLGTYADSANTVGLEGTNIYTMFRGLIQDFTLPGAFLVCGLWGLYSGHAYSQRSLEAAPVLGLAAYYAVSLFSALMCPFTFNSTIFAWLVAWLVLRRKVEKLSSRSSVAIVPA